MFEHGYPGYPAGYQNPYMSRYNAMTSQQAPKYEIIRVNGENGAQALQMSPNSEAIVLDDTAPMVWLCQTDGVAIIGATATSTAAAGAATDLAFSAIVRNIGCGSSILSFVLTGAAATVSNFAVSVVKL